MAIDRLSLGKSKGRLFLILDPLSDGRSIIVDDRVMGWVADHIPGIPTGYAWSNARSIGLGENGQIIAGMIVHDYVRAFRNCQITFAASTPRWATRSSIRALLRYPFEQLGCDRVTTIIAETNRRAIRFNEGIGFKLEGRSRKGCGAADALIFGLLREEAPAWMGFTASN